MNLKAITKTGKQSPPPCSREENLIALIPGIGVGAPVILYLLRRWGS